MATAHDAKFDRQLRLWGGHGQSRLEKARVAMLGSSASAAETLKNLVLPNVGHFTIFDDALVSRDDIANSYFVDEPALGESRAACVAKWLREMNGSVHIEVQERSLHSLLSPSSPPEPPLSSSSTSSSKSSSAFSLFDSYSLVIVAAHVQPDALLSLASHLYDKNIPLIWLRTYGLIGYARVQIKEHLIVESHPNERHDLYLHPLQLQHLPELKTFLEGFVFAARPSVSQPFKENFAEMEDQATTSASSSSSAQLSSALSTSAPWNGDGSDTELHAHIPYVAILHEALRRWQSTSQSAAASSSQTLAVPRSQSERDAIKQIVIDLAWGDFGSETNFNEAVDSMSRIYNLPVVERSTQAVLRDLQCAAENLTASSDDFWICVAALNQFLQRSDGVNWPVSVDIPDMHCKTEWYVMLKTIFKNKSEDDCVQIMQLVQKLCNTLHHPLIDEAYIRYFVRHCRDLTVVRTNPIQHEFPLAAHSSFVAQADSSFAASAQDMSLSSTLNSILEEASFDSLDADTLVADQPFIPNPCLIHWYLSLRACDLFQRHKQRWPGALTARELSMLHSADADEDEVEFEADDSWRADADEVIAYLNVLHKQLEINFPAESDCAIEMTRSAACEPHVIASFMGGVGAQIGLKLLLQQYVPLNNTLLYNGIHCSSATFKL